MLNRLTEFINQTKGLSTSRVIYFDQGYSYTFDDEQLVQARTDFRNDKKGGAFFSDKTFKVNVDELNEFVKNFKKSIIMTNVTPENTLEIRTSIPNTSFITTWDKHDKSKLEEIKTFFDSLDLDENKKICNYSFTKDEIRDYVSEKSQRIFVNLTKNSISFEDNKDSLDHILMISILPKYLGKILKESTNELRIDVYNTDKETIYLVCFTVVNKNLITEHYGLCSDLILIKEGGTE